MTMRLKRPSRFSNRSNSPKDSSRTTICGRSYSRNYGTPKAGHWRAGIKKVPTPGRAFRAFNSIRKVQRDTKTGLITVQIDWKDPVKAANWTNQLVERLNDEMRNRALKQAEASMGYLQNEFANTVDVSTREAISRLMEGQIKQRNAGPCDERICAAESWTRPYPPISMPRCGPSRFCTWPSVWFSAPWSGCCVALWLDKRKLSVGK